jgi:hypothetical protein
VHVDRRGGFTADHPAAVNALKPGDTLRGNAAPQFANRAFTISCTVETSESDAVILAHGGPAAGYALHIYGVHILFTVRTGRDNGITEITTPSALTSPARITAALAADGTMTLTVNNASPVAGKATRLIRRLPARNFCRSHDDAQPVTTYTGKETFKNSISQLKFSTL